MNIGERIKARRIQIGLTQEDLAIKMGYKSRSSINKIEMGENDIPQSKIVAFADALVTTTAYLMGWDQEKIDEIEQIENSANKEETEHEIELKKIIASMDDSEFNELLNYARYIVSKRKK